MEKEKNFWKTSAETDQGVESGAQGVEGEKQEKDEQAPAETWKQEQAPWEDFEEDNIDENFERRPPVQEEKEKMNESLKSLGNIFEGSDINWHLDGAMNISLMNKGSDEEQVDYIGVHKDVDISVEEKELEELEEQLKEKGYGLFLSETEIDENGERSKVLRRVGYRQFKGTENAHPLIMSMDNQGNVQPDKELSGVDVHIIERSEEGEPLGYSGVTVPEEWVQPQPMTFQGEQINLSHPAKVLYHKLHQNRGYDTSDVKHLLETDTLQEEDLENMEKVFQEEFQANRSRAAEIFREVSSEINENMNKEEIFEAMLKQSELKTRSEQGMEAGLKSLAEKIAESNDKSTESILEQAYELFQIEEKNNKKMEEISSIKQQIEDKKKLEEVRAELKEYQSQEQKEKEPKVDQKLLDTVDEFNQIFQEHEQPLWVMGSMAIAAQQESPHRDIDNDVDFMTTDEHVNETIDDLEERGFVVEEGWGTKFRAYHPETGTRGDFAVLQINKETGNFEAEGSSFPEEGFPDETKMLNNVEMKPLSLELLYTMKKTAAEKSGGKHAVDMQAIQEEAARRGIDENSLESYAEETTFKGIKDPTVKLETEEQRDAFQAKKEERIQEFKNAFIELYNNTQNQKEETPPILKEAISKETLKRVRHQAEQSGQQEDFLQYVHQKFNSYLTEYIQQQVAKEV